MSANLPPLPDKYTPAEHEPRIRAAWEQSGAFHPDPARVLRGEAEPFAIVIPPPNVTAALHLGHALNNTLQDILARNARMRGYETLWMPGTDHAGIATQAVVEKRVQKEEGKRRKDFSREEFVAKIQAFKDEYEAVITTQLKVMGCSCDWERQRFTMDEQCARAVYEAFFRLFADGLIYRGKRLVNWDPELQTAVADDECYDAEVEGAFWYLRYPLVEPVVVAGESVAHITVATTRPETFLGDTAIAMNPRDPRAAALVGRRVHLPFISREIPIVADDYAVLREQDATTDEQKNDPKAKFSTGFVKITPAHDQNDDGVYQRNKASIPQGPVNMMSPDGRVSDQHGWDGPAIPAEWLGKKMAQARKLIVEAFKDRGLLEGIRPHRHTVKHSDRSKAVIEPYLSDQWYVRVTDPKMAEAANKSIVREHEGEGSDNTLSFHPPRYAKTFEQWHIGIRDWCISRQLWWGHRIPVWSGPASKGDEGWIRGHANVFPEDRELVANGGPIRWFSTYPGQTKPHSCCWAVRDSATDTWQIAMAIAPDQPRAIADAERDGYVQDPDVLDTWFSSALWPLSTMGWPDDTDLLRAFNPTTTLCTAREIITLWVSRMVMFNRYFLPKDWPTSEVWTKATAKSDTEAWPRNPNMADGRGTGPVPFKDVVIHAVIQDGEGRKMSKSLGNGIDPLEIIESHGSDAMRFTLTHMTTQTQDVRMPVEKDSRTGRNTSKKFDLGRSLVNKLYNATTGVALHNMPASGSTPPATEIDPQTLSTTDRWLLSRLHATIQVVDESIATYDYSAYATALYDFIYRDLCDWYLEAVKPTLKNDPAQQAVLARTLDVVLRIAHPVMPFITEALWPHVANLPVAQIKGLTLGPSRKANLLCTASWPSSQASLVAPEAEAAFDRLRAFVSAVREVRATQQVPPKRKITAHIPASLQAELAPTGHADAWVYAVAGIATVKADNPLSGMPAVSLRVLDTDISLTDLADAVDIEAESDRKRKKVSELAKEIDTINARLSNPGYIDRAPPRLVEESRSKLQKLQLELDSLR